MLFARDNIVLYLMQLMALEVSYIVLGLESVHIKVPMAVPLGTSATLVCECDLSDEDLYSVKWYKGKHEFFRYTSKEIPSIKIFPKAGISVNVNLSNASHLVLDGIEPLSSGRYSCEITEAAPSFHTKIATRTMHVVDLPAGGPRIEDMKSYYGADEFLEVKCIAGASLPAAKLTWLINDRPLLQPLVAPSRLESVTLPASATEATELSSPASSADNLSNSSKRIGKKKVPVKSSSQQQQEPSEPAPGEGEESSSTRPRRMALAASHANGMLGPVAPTSSFNLDVGPVATDTVGRRSLLSIATRAGNTSVAAGSETRKVTTTSQRYEISVSHLKLLLEHGHFQMGKLKVECIARIFDLYERTAVETADENYPQVRVLSNSDNGVHFSFMSDKDEASSTAARHSPPTLGWILEGAAQFASFIASRSPFPMACRTSLPTVSFETRYFG
ncbi:uncharacterized protein LOC128278818 [Anopheles cruzii]|uniref:uncharacterized protein LOC128278818 n=1 Tax=Anopheles cruzii TaxID=68878 RepID=UPI0022EC51FE|nr:uncharacterized protein LOC128278818 [Anopheles cruzii]